MADKQAVEARRLKIQFYIAAGLKPVEVLRELKISWRTYYRDIAAIQKMPRSENEKAYCMIFILENRERLLRDMMQVRTRARTDELYLSASIAAGQILNELVKDLVRFGLLPPEKKVVKIQKAKGRF